MKNSRKTLLALAFITLVSFSFTTKLVDDYDKEITEWQQNRINELRGARSPLNLVGYYGLKEGANTFGSGKNNDIIFPDGKIPAYAGTFFLKDGVVTLEVEKDVPILSKGKKFENSVVYTSSAYTVLEYGSLQWFVHKNSNELNIRLLDLKSKSQLAFTGVDRFPVNKDLRLKAKFQPYAPASTIAITTIYGKTSDRPSAGLLTFTIDAKEYKFEALGTGAGQKLFIVFSDKTGDKESYRFRFLNTDAPDENGFVTLDFNKATNPNCAFSPIAPCPLPPKQNVLPIAIEAGEKKYKSEI
ncbi:DUF1684 domain-containing protein [Emticicia sp. BO119]|uniref:DUF1684 domain-containing protein n=1 Tax=Emticicia sp. BO119 TaxID=2757768 RepID=UPI0015F0F1CC|nr:DUF1684 domain-containing protein [Emticicia sp. BO119]MBA4850571.1 DUF1684 domain-containing protein [Emticicia sp. BO119]